MNCPEISEYAPYFQRYITKVPQGNIIDILVQQIEDTLQLLQSIPEEKAGYRYAADKWSIKEVVGHVIDTERIFAYRLLCFSREDKTPLPSFEQDAYVEHAHFDQRTFNDLNEEFRLVRLSNIALLRSFDGKIEKRRGTASGFEFTVRAIAYIMAGHELHHRAILKERYLAGLSLVKG